MRGVAVVFACLAIGCQVDPFEIAGPRSCEIRDQNDWVYGLMGRFYLWNEDLPAIEPRWFESPGELVASVRTDIDHWSRVVDKETSDLLFREGVAVGFGFRTRRDGDRNLRISSVYPGSPAQRAGLVRSDQLLTINGRTIEEIDAANAWDEVWGESRPGTEIRAQVQSRDGTRRNVTLIKDWVQVVSISHSQIIQRADRVIGYFVFETFMEPAQAALDQLFADFAAVGVDTVVVDLRYNGGGLVEVARHLANLLGGAAADGEVMYRMEYNDSLVGVDDERRFDRRTHSLDPRDLVFITTASTLSASELVINALRPYVNVHVVGTTTGGKPFGSRSWDFCDQVAFPLTFRLVNAEGVTDYTDGFEPDCVASDDLSHALGDPEEESLLRAIGLVEHGECGSSSSIVPVPTPTRSTDPLSEILGGAH